MHTHEERQLRTGRLMYILFAAFEYLTTLTVTGSFLAKLTTQIGMSDSMTGVISAVAALGGVFQLLSMFIHRPRVKRLVIALTAVNQILFIALYLIPLLVPGKQVSQALFTLTIVMAYLLYNIVAPKKNSWMMSLVEDRRRGIFTAYKEMVSLVMGMVFTFGMGALFDYLEGMGRLQAAFGLTAAVVTILTLLSVLCMVFMVERPVQVPSTRKPLLRQLMQNRRLRSVTVLYIIYYIAINASIPFFHTYQLSELGFSLTLISGFGILSSVARILVSPYWGRYADRKSFAALLEKCFLVLGAAFLCAMLASPGNGVIMFGLYYIFHGVAMGGVNSGIFNLVFDCAEAESRADALAVCQSISGLTGFGATLLFSLVVSHMQAAGNSLLGMTVYAQQLLALVSLLCTLAAALYIRLRLSTNQSKE